MMIVFHRETEGKDTVSHLWQAEFHRSPPLSALRRAGDETGDEIQ
jgi:hypothetical protein